MSLPSVTLDRIESLLRPNDGAVRREGDVLRRSYSDVIVEVRCREKVLSVSAVSPTVLTDRQDLGAALELAAGPDAGRMLAATSVERTETGGRMRAVFDTVITAGATDTQLLRLLRRSLDICASTVTEQDQRIAELAKERQEAAPEGRTAGGEQA
ncbi:MAG: hypothetical protein E7Z96_00925 [Actinomycetaceae bacterium]|nr:hypothetical protein [Actinomycetaceae bacterium]